MKTIATISVALALGTAVAAAQYQPPAQQGQGPAVEPPAHQTGATKDMNKAVPPMTPEAKAETGKAGGWTSDNKLRETGQKGAVEKSAKQNQKDGSSTQ